MTGASNINDICTVSDEAFALLTYENNIDRWTDIYSKDPNALLPRLGSGKLKNFYYSMVPTKYTRGGIQYEDELQDGRTKGAREGKGWSNEGIRRFNALYDLVIQDRKDNPNFFHQYIVHFMDKHGRTKKRERPKVGHVVVQARHNLFGGLNNGSHCVLEDENRNECGQERSRMDVDNLVDSSPSSDEEDGGMQNDAEEYGNFEEEEEDEE